MKRLQVMVKDETFDRVNELIAKCNEGFDDGSVKSQDIVDWMLANASYDIQKIRSRCLSPSKIKGNARLECKEDVDELIKKLNLIKPLMKSKDEK